MLLHLMDKEKEMQKSQVMSSNLHSWWMKVLEFKPSFVFC